MGSVGESSVEDQFNSTTLEALLSCKVREQVQDYIGNRTVSHLLEQ